jgi:hypothetical protein
VEDGGVGTIWKDVYPILLMILYIAMSDGGASAMSSVDWITASGCKASSTINME